MRWFGMGIWGAGLLALSAPASATTLMTQDFVCPVGGERFSDTVYGSLFLYGDRPDGRPLGTGRGYLNIPECPKNHLVLYRDFSKAELPLLKKAIETPEYKAMAKTETRFYRAAWLEKAINPNSADYVWYLLTATWYVGKDQGMKARYQEQFLAVAELLPAESADLKSLLLRLRVLNVYRERGQFDRMLSALDALRIEALATGLPAGTPNEVTLADRDWERWLVVRTARQLRVLALRQDPAVNPIDMLPDWMTAQECYFREPKTAFETAFCATPEMKTRIEDEGVSEEDRWEYEYDGPITGPPPPPKPMKTSPK